MDFGARGDGLAYDTAALQAAIDACASHRGGGSVIIPATLFLRSHVTLHLEANATLLASPELSTYPAERARWYALLAENATGVALTGAGTIHGQGEKFVERWDDAKNMMVSWNTTGQCSGDECRPRLVGFLDCTDVAVTGVRLVEPAYWCLHLVRCARVLVRGVAITGNFTTPNNDGIDIDGSNDTLVERVRVDTGDDAICPKSTAGPTRNLTVRNSWLRTKSCAVKLGSGSEHDFADLRFEGLEIEDAHRGLGIQLRDQGSVSNIYFANIRMSTRYYDPSWWGRAEPIYITACPRSLGSSLGSIRNVTFVNITAVSENGIFVSGHPQSLVHDLVFDNVSLSMNRWTNHSGGLHDYRPGCQGLVSHNTSGLFMDQIYDVYLRNVSINWGPMKGPNWTPIEVAPLALTRMVIDGLSFTDVHPEAEVSPL
eukprot:jgi/Mesen1/5556/ME000280S04683